jgi:hypothetical protein
LDSPKILLLDIETRPWKGYGWRLFKENIGLDQIIDPGGISCFAAKWFGSKDMEFYSDWDNGHEEMIRQAHRLIEEADAVVTYNGDKFDLPKLQGEFLLAGLKPPAPATSIDIYKTVRYKLGFLNNRLAFVADMLKIGAKVKHEGFMLWRKVEEGDENAMARMGRYCKGDVRLLERAYRRIRPYIFNHPHLGKVGAAACGVCGSHHTQSRGYRRTKSFRIQRLQCQACGGWQDGKRQKVT